MSIIEVNNISKKYKIQHNRGGYVALRDVLTNAFKNPFRYAKNKTKAIIQGKEDFWALKDINFTVEKGDAIGIIGHNGAGKSTLLKVLSQITPPTRGEIKLKGRVASLLEVGTGFNPELTGRENIFLNGAILGMTKQEITNKFDEIVEFSGIEKFIDTPAKRYSSGMFVRLAFAVAAHMEPDILLVDEVLAVGDAEFQKKCLGKMDEVTKQEGRTILFVSHNMGAIQNLCKKCILLTQGKIKMVGETNNVITKYLQSKTWNQPQIKFKPNLNKKAQILEITIKDQNAEINNRFNYQDNFKIELIADIRTKNKNYYTIIIIYDSIGNIILASTDEDSDDSFISNLDRGKCKYTINFPNKLFKPGQYYITISLTSKDEGKVDKHEHILNFEVIDYISKRGINKGYRPAALVAPEIEWIPKIINK